MSLGLYLKDFLARIFFCILTCKLSCGHIFQKLMDCFIGWSSEKSHGEFVNTLTNLHGSVCILEKFVMRLSLVCFEVHFCIN